MLSSLWGVGKGTMAHLSGGLPGIPNPYVVSCIGGPGLGGSHFSCHYNGAQADCIEYCH